MMPEEHCGRAERLADWNGWAPMVLAMLEDDNSWIDEYNLRV
jgi:hypothetical protein